MNKMSHSELAMQEARNMARSPSRKKSSRIICHHLLRMLAGDETMIEVGAVSPAPGRVKRRIRRPANPGETTNRKPEEESRQPIDEPQRQMPLHFNGSR